MVVYITIKVKSRLINRCFSEAHISAEYHYILTSGMSVKCHARHAIIKPVPRVIERLGGHMRLNCMTTNNNK